MVDDADHASSNCKARRQMLLDRARFTNTNTKQSQGQVGDGSTAGSTDPARRPLQRAKGRRNTRNPLHTNNTMPRPLLLVDHGLEGRSRYVGLAKVRELRVP